MRTTLTRIAIAAAVASAGTGTAASNPVVAAVAAPDVIISELMINPSDVYDARGEWIELLNRGPVAINLAEWALSDEKTETLALPTVTLAPGERYILARNGDPLVNGGIEADWEYGNEIILYNDSDKLILSDASGQEQDRVKWSPSSGIVIPNGRSLALGESPISVAETGVHQHRSCRKATSVAPVSATSATTRKTLS